VIKYIIILLSISFSQLLLDEYISLKDHPKAKGVNIKLQPPEGWSVKEGLRPNIVKKFVHGTNTFLIIINDNMTFFSTTQTRELFEDKEFKNHFINEAKATLIDGKLINQKVVTIDRYPALEFTLTGSLERAGFKTNMIMKNWYIYYEDKIILFQCNALNEEGLSNLELLYSLIINSVIFPDRWNRWN